ncbi:hypothetical protein F5887DRAFT_1010504 [Amanita rubescens]|nr:hypothetical protein F5887DRAFT_1010504 [Amanita rubescens]
MSVTIAALPPTVNDLPPDQRTRLLRSTRKLGNVLGATPHVIDHHDSLLAGPSKRRDNTLFSHSASSSVTSLAAVTTTHISDNLFAAPIEPAATGGHKRRNSKELPRLLVLRLQSVPPPASEPVIKTLTPSSSTSLNLSVPAPLSLPPRPLSMSMIPPSPAPTMDSFNLDGPDNIRRRRMAKLTRTLGENIPTELVFPRHHHKSPSEPTPRGIFTFGTERNTVPLAVRPIPPHPSQFLSQNTSSGEETKSRPLPPIPQSPRNATVQRSRSLTVGAQTSRTGYPSWKPPSRPIRAPIPDPDEKPQRSWDGEWNIKDAEKRAMALRNLKKNRGY